MSSTSNCSSEPIAATLHSLDLFLRCWIFTLIDNILLAYLQCPGEFSDKFCLLLGRIPICVQIYLDA